MGPVLLANKYLLLKRIASGGMAEIFLSKQVGFDGFEKLVVVKRILPEFMGQQEYVRMFLDEARTAADLRHPNIVSTFEIAQDNGTYFMVMEYLHGLDLRFIFRKLLSHKDKIPLSIAIGIVMEVCAGLHYAHKKTDLKGQPLGIVHRDVSPQNLVVTFDGETKIVDFGIAQGKHLKDQDTKGILKGKFGYMSPEQAGGYELDQRTDQFSLGIILYELTTMHRLFRRRDHEDALTLATNCHVDAPSTKVADYPPALESIVMKALAKNREERFADCDELRAALLEFLHDHSIPYSRDKLANFMREKFNDEQDQKIDAALAGFDHERLNSTYLSRQTRSHSGEYSYEREPVKWKYVSLAVMAVLGVGLSVGAAVFFITRQAEPQREPVAVAVAVPPEPPPQSLGIPLFEEVKPAAKPEKKKFGRLKIVVEPWGEIHIDGKLVGLTPLAPQKIMEGTHTVRIKNARLGPDKTLKVVVRANQDTLVRHQFSS
jgi:serine/threonine protein kinase